MLEELKNKQFSFKKQFGQNFLTDGNLLKSICISAGIDKDSNILEIGTGAGTLTTFLTQFAKKVVSYEIDKELHPLLTEKFKDTSNLNLVFKDFMKDSMQDVEKLFDGKYMVVANIPYYITTPLIFKVIEEGKNATSLVLMVQEEVGQRFTAPAGTKQYGAVSVMLNYYGQVSIIKHVKRHMFTPVPNVDSCVVKIDLKPNKFNVNKDVFSKCVQCAFENRRKMLISNLKRCFNITTEQLENIFNKLNLDLTIRGERLSVEQFAKLSCEIEKCM